MFLQHVNEAARLNFVGCTLLAGNNARGAMTAFRSAVTIMETLSRSEESHQWLQSKQEKMCVALEMPPLFGDEAFFAFAKPLVFQVTPQSVDLGFFNAVIIFNLGLVFHQVAMKRGDSSKLAKAVHFYELVRTLIGEDTTASAGALLLASKNNSTHASYQLGDWVKFREGLEDMEEDTARLAAHGHPAFFEADHLQEFFLNIAVAKEPTAAPSA